MKRAFLASLLGPLVDSSRLPRLLGESRYFLRSAGHSPRPGLVYVFQSMFILALTY
jgi:hypothetical protein